MKPRSSESTIIGAGLLVFIGLSLYFIMHAGPQKEAYSALSSYSPEPSGAMALYELLGASGLKVERNVAGNYHYPEGGCVVLMTDKVIDPASLMGGGLDPRAVSQWIRRGGRLVLFSSALSYETGELFKELSAQAKFAGQGAALDAASALAQQTVAAEAAAALAGGPLDPAHADRDAGASGTPGSPGATIRLAQSSGIYNVVQPPPPLFGDLTHLELAPPDYAKFDIGAPLLTADDPPLPIVSWLPLGQGELLWVSAPELASNAWINRADNHRLLLDVLAYAARGGLVSFDEYSHGYREQSVDATGVLFQSAGGRLLLLLLALSALAFAGAAIAPARFLPPPVPPRRQAQEMVLAQASLYARAGLRRGVALHLLDGLRQAVRRHEHWNTAPDDARLGQWLRDAQQQGLPVDATLLKVLDGKLALGTPQQLLHFAQACDKLRARLA